MPSPIDVTVSCRHALCGHQQLRLLRLEAYFDMFRTIHGKAERMCPGGSFAGVFDAVSASVQAASHRFAKLHVAWIEDIICEGVKKGQLTIGEQRPGLWHMAPLPAVLWFGNLTTTVLA